MNFQVLVDALNISLDRAKKWAGPVTDAMREFGINTPEQQAAFLAQIAHESNCFASVVESFNYSVSGLELTFGARIKNLAEKLGRKGAEKVVPIERQRAIANIVYANRYGNGDSSSGDGWRYRGRGLKQITFLENYERCGIALGIDLLSFPEQLESDVLAARSAAWFWFSINGNRYVAANDFDGLSKRINGNGISDKSLSMRRVRWLAFKRALEVV